MPVYRHDRTGAAGERPFLAPGDERLPDSRIDPCFRTGTAEDHANFKFRRMTSGCNDDRVQAGL